jgi:hypothetical protein
MTRKEFLEENQRAMRDATRHSLNVVVPAFILLIGLMLCAKPLIEYINRHDCLDWVVSLKSYWFEGGLGFVLLFFIFAGRCVRQPFGVPCPACRRRLVGVTGRLAVITGNCGYCGEKVVEDFGSSLNTDSGSDAKEPGPLLAK